MPSIPIYNIQSTEEAGLNRAKKRINKILERGLIKLTETPASDPTDGNADKLAETIIRQMDELSGVLQQAVLPLQLSDEDEGLDFLRKTLRDIINSQKKMRQISKDLNSLLKGISYISLSLYYDLLNTWKYLSDQFDIVFAFLLTYQNTFEEFTNFQKLVSELKQNYDKIFNTMSSIIQTFNAARQQKVFARETIAEDDIISGGQSYKKPVYRVGSHLMSSLYELDGLPKFL
jgi:hypothetical protein